MKRLIIFFAFYIFSVVSIAAEKLETPIGELEVIRVVSGLKTPWALGLLPDGRFLVTERRGRLWLADSTGKKSGITGVPTVVADGQGGLLDVLIPRDFAATQTIFLTFAKSQPNGSGTAVASAILDLHSNQLSHVKVIFEMSPGSKGGRHFGSRLVEADNGQLYVSIGERGDRPSAQDISRHNGSIVRINRDGSVPADNPFIDTPNAAPEIWSYGHRNPQGMAIDRAGKLWAVEHGARGGDEINLIQKGGNFGWPTIAYGRHYTGGIIGEGTHKKGLRQPEFYWDPSIAPSGMMIYSGKMFPEWRDFIFVGSLKFDYISGLSGSNLKETLTLKSSATKRVRDIRQGQDGSIWFISEDRGAIYQIRR